MKALVLGGTGFIGLHLVRLLHSQGHEVSVLNRGRSKADLPEGVTRLTADRNDPSQVKAALKDAPYDAAFDISGYTPAQLLPVMQSLEGRVGHFVFCSSGAVYDPTETSPIKEDYPLFRGPEADQYARDKITCEDMLMEAFNKRGFPATVIRPPYVYGPDDALPQRDYTYFAQLTQRRPIIIPGDGHSMIPFVHTDDLAAAFVAAVGRSNALGQAYNATGPEGITANALVRTFGEVMGVTPEIIHARPMDYDPLARELGDSWDEQIFPYGWTMSEATSNDKAKRDLEWSPRYDMREGLAMTYRWWLEQGLDKEEMDFSLQDRALAVIAEGSGRHPIAWRAGRRV